MTLTLPNVHSFQLPDPSWQWVSPRWLIDMTRDVDDDGWQYAARFSAAWHGRHSAQAFVRRRRWLRLRRRLRQSAVGDDDVDMCLNPAVALEAAGGGRAQPMIRAAASKIKSKVSGNYVGSSPRSPTSPTARALAYTLKDGRYRSHNLKSPPPPPPIPPLPPTHALPSHTNSVSSSAQPSLHNSSDTPKPAASSAVLALDASDVSDVPLAHKCRHHSSSTQAAVEPLPLPTGGFAAIRTHPHELLSAAGSLAATDVSSAGEEEPPPAGYASFLPRLVALAPPETTVPLGGFARSHSTASPPQQPVRMLAAARRRQTSPPAVTSLVMSDEDAGSTVVASQTDMRQESPSFSLRRKMSAASSLSRLVVSRPQSVASMEYLDNDLAPMDAYVDPYAPLQLPSSASAGADDAAPVDGRLVEVATATLRQMLAGVRLDRERLDILRGGLVAGGVTAATIWYALGWLHYELMQYDHGRQQLIAMLLAFSHTCPRDAPLKYGGEVLTVVSPSEVWRRVVRPVIEMDADLFYSDFKLMAVGVARWNLLKTNDARG
ncbi:hypothetical protein H4S07_001676 [Coemansia furcata]|uniref:Uncharacterized protein n=1 Tax=Coemansia furcata TaxID=417177 RepID=A0ACC1LLQ5_9FUNG|nr:hypothetical protein H4S07_001676 [Coemansia furcata]